MTPRPKHLKEDEPGAGVEPGPSAEAALQVRVGRREPPCSKEGHEQKQRRQIGDEIGHMPGDVAPVPLVGEAGHGQEGHGTDDGGHQGDPHHPTRHLAAGQEIGFRRFAACGRCRSRWRSWRPGSGRSPENRAISDSATSARLLREQSELYRIAARRPSRHDLDPRISGDCFNAGTAVSWPPQNGSWELDIDVVGHDPHH